MSLNKMLQIFGGLALIFAGVTAITYLWPVNVYFAILAGTAAIGFGLIIWFPRGAKHILEAMFEAI